MSGPPNFNPYGQQPQNQMYPPNQQQVNLVVCTFISTNTNT